jgi:GMP synthase (glutamine-hydrolysing)
VSPEVVLILQHHPDDGPGNLHDWLDARGLEQRVIDVPAGELPAPGRYRALVVLGSKESAYDMEIDWIRAEHDFVDACMAAGTPVFGICFGAQLLAMRLGGQVGPMGSSEIGWCEVRGEQPYGGTWFVWHGDHVTAPPGSIALADTDRCLHTYRHGAHLGVQFHPEVTAAQVDQWLASPPRRAALIGAGGDVAEIVQQTPALAPVAADAAGSLYESFFVNSRTAPPRPARAPAPK